ncbi:MAG: hypothetical protein NVSMB45_13810 [Ginsengibacter sp.]
MLALIADNITQNHSKYINDSLFKKLDLNETFYKSDLNYLQHGNLVNSYIDRFSNGKIENVSKWQKANVASMIGDDGIYCSPKDAIKFLKGIFEMKVLNDESLTQFLTFVKDDKGNDIYSTGLFNFSTKAYKAYGHGGAGIGSGCGIFYLPQKNKYIFMAINLGTIIQGPLVDKADELKNKLLQLLCSK